MHHRVVVIASSVLLLAAATSPARAVVTDAAVDAAVSSSLPQVVTWRRDFHQHPELGNREFRTSKIVAEQLRKMGLEVRTGIAHTGVVGILRGGKPGPTIALRADMDGLPVTENNDLPFKSLATSEFRGEKVGVMHACGHDAHVAILLGTAKVLSGMRSELPGTVMFVFQPAEEGAPEGEQGGARLMLEQGVFADPRPEAVFGLHVFSMANVGTVLYREGPLMAATDRFRIVVKGRQTHGARPWNGVDPIVTASQIVLALQPIVSRQVDITQFPAVVTIGAIKGGIRNNIIPESVELIGTYRTFDPKVREDIAERINRIVTNVAEANGAIAEFERSNDPVPAVVNDPALTQRVLASLQRSAGKDNVVISPYNTASEDFSFYGQDVPSFFHFVGSTPQGIDPKVAPSNHSPTYFFDEGALPIGLRTTLAIAIDYLQAP